MKLQIDVTIQKNSKCDRECLLGLARDPKLAVGVSVVYIYSLIGKPVNYPEKAGQVVYIGEAGRPTEPTGKRFAQHVSTSEDKGGDSGTIYSLSRYYWRGRRIRLRVFLVDSIGLRKAKERDLLNAHVKEFGALPICQGTTGVSYGTMALSDLVVTKELQALISPVSNKSKQSGSASVATV